MAKLLDLLECAFLVGVQQLYRVM